MSAPLTSLEGLAALASVIDVYEHRIGYVCRAIAGYILALLTLFPSSSGTVLDNACGTGAVLEELLKKFPKAEIYAADVVPPMVQAFEAIIASKTELQKQVKEPWCDPALAEKILKDGGFSKADFTVVKEGLWGKDEEGFKKVLLENFGTMTMRNWTEQERAKLPEYISKVVDEQQDKFCITDEAKIGVLMKAWVAIATK
ncbi:hypothetical protein DE146DRAFT_782317 [Phaeosphaeria sp. MPI-PUGE-AT-0046c]|nr:hypothetical protein DE146DRAFT_782317 [Phaeosphaeria sp. MPI-PUGE-AT-0046c]